MVLHTIGSVHNFTHYSESIILLLMHIKNKVYYLNKNSHSYLDILFLNNF